ncbi:hypothetical protein CHH28_14670 [Bacterioplanes sanyensis]|uniref:Uncharacterized protein n=1 Tax=Bacterioplanes sanyensis TaxID=1249553 RepID=A0A222FM33_9GAMM|nr:hypothetical protein [Bacterioplanes sanyensis]ASP39840.1 hypothetical protein CHH28_14670 [Bacterioplanes sanyensis]
MKKVTSTIVALMLSGVFLSIYIPKTPVEERKVLFNVDAKSIYHPIPYADISIAEWRLDPDGSNSAKFGLLLALVTSADDANTEASRWLTLLEQSQSRTLPLTLFTLQDGQRTWQALVMGPAKSVDALSPYQRIALGNPFANQLVLWPAKSDSKEKS